MKLARAVSIVDELGIALVYPIDNKPEPPSLWSAAYPRSEMSWTWDADADPRVAEIWHLREKLASSSEVAYGKWFRGRATLFSLPVFHALLGRIANAGSAMAGLSPEAIELLERLRELSPRSTKELRAEAGLKGKPFESVFTHAMKALWARFLIVGTGEVADGAFPSLAVSATEMMFEDLWIARTAVPRAAEQQLQAVLARSPMFAKELARSVKAVQDAAAIARRAVDDDELGGESLGRAQEDDGHDRKDDGGERHQAPTAPRRIRRSK